MNIWKKILKTKEENKIPLFLYLSLPLGWNSVFPSTLFFFDIHIYVCVYSFEIYIYSFIIETICMYSFSCFKNEQRQYLSQCSKVFHTPFQ